jgi:hypothetical protein
MATQGSRFRVLALVYPLERHVGHWACSSPHIDVTRVVVEGDVRGAIWQAVDRNEFDAVAIVGKRKNEYLDLVDNLGRELPSLRDLPRIYRCQNTNIMRQLRARVPTRELLATLSHWFESASDRRYALVLVQSHADCDLIREALSPTLVRWCPYGYDPAFLDADSREQDRPVDVGCYFSLKGSPARVELVEKAAAICARRGWAFCFRTGVYGREYVQLIQTTRVCLHRSLFSEIPYRLYEASCLGSVLVTDPLETASAPPFEAGRHYLTYHPDLHDLESVLDGILADRSRCRAMALEAQERARQHSWPAVAERYVAPALADLCGRRLGAA